MNWFLPAGIVFTITGVLCLGIFEGWAVYTNRPAVLALSDYLRMFIATHPALAVLIVAALALIYGAVLMHLYTS